MCRARYRTLALMLAAVTTMACGGVRGLVGGAPAAPTAAASSAPAVNPACDRLAVRGITPCPPARLSQEPIVVRNGTRGAVPDDTVRTEGEAYIRTHSLADWAVRQAAGDAFLLSGAIVSADVARTNIFRTEVRVFSDGHAAGATVRIQPLRTTEITLVPVPAALQTAARQDGLQPSAYAWVDNQMGPALVTQQAPGRAATEVVRIPDREPHPILVFGEEREDADLGSIWYIGGEFGCLASVQDRLACQL